MCVTPSLPNLQNTGSDYSQLLNQFVGGVPTQLQTEATYKPGFINTSLEGVNQSIYGRDGISGLLNDYRGAVQPLAQSEAAANRVSRGANVGDVGRLGAQAAGAVRGINPEQTALTDALGQSASTALAAGSRLDPGSVAQISNSVRGDWASRGLGDSNPAQLSEAMQFYGAGQNVLSERQNQARQAIGVENANITMPALNMVSGTSGAPGQAQNFISGAGGLSSNAGASLVPTGEMSDLLSTIYNARAAQGIAGANNDAALMSGAMSY